MDTMVGHYEEDEACEAKTMKDYAKYSPSRTYDPTLSARDDGLTGFFPPTIGCLFEDLDAILSGDAPLEFGTIYIERLERILRDFKNAFTLEQYFPMYGLVKYYLDILEYPMGEMKVFFNTPAGTPPDTNRASIYFHFIRDHLDLLMEIAREIDQISR